MRITVMSRGHGFGHAARDLKVVEAIRSTRPDVRVDIASAGSGAEFYRARGIPVTDLGIEDADDTSLEATWRLWRFLHEDAPTDLVLVDEFMTVPGFCRNVLQVPSVLVTDWFHAEIGLPENDALLDDATEVVVPDFPQAHRTPPATTAPVWYSGPLVRSFPEVDARRELGIAADALVVVVAQGGRPDRRATLETQLRVLRVWNRNARPHDRLLLLADPPPVRGTPPRTPTIRWVGRTDRPELYYRAADVVVADAFGFTVCELVHNGVPALAVVHADPGHHVREGVADRLELLESTGLLLRATLAEDPSHLWRALTRLAAARPGRPLTGAAWGDPHEVATRVLGHLGAAR